jgi:hypothetical protein
MASHSITFADDKVDASALVERRVRASRLVAPRAATLAADYTQAWNHLDEL